MKFIRRKVLALPVAVMAAFCFGALNPSARAASAEDLTRSANEALQLLYRTNPLALDISKRAKAILVFPNIIRAGLIFGGAYGEGVLLKDSVVVDYYNSWSGSWGLQIGAQSFGYAVFLLTDDAVKYLKESHGWEFGTGPTVVLVNAGVAKNLTTTTLQESNYAFIFNQQGLMAGLSIEGTKVTQITR